MKLENEKNEVQANKPSLLSALLGLVVSLGLLGTAVGLWLVANMLKLLPLVIVVIVVWKYVL